VNYTWTDGIPNRTVSATNTGVYISGQNRGLSDPCAGRRHSTAIDCVYGRVRHPSRITVHLSDNSGSRNVDTSFASSGSQAVCLTVRYTAASSGQSLTVTILQNTSGEI